VAGGRVAQQTREESLRGGVGVGAGGSGEGADRSESGGESSGRQFEDRFVRQLEALQGAYDPVDGTEDVEGVDGLFNQAFLTFPCAYVFTVVGRGGDDAGVGLQASVLSLVREATGDGDARVVRTRDRLGGKFVSLDVQARVQTSHVITDVHARLRDHPSILYTF